MSMLVLRVYPHMKLFETTIADVTLDSDYFITFPSRESQGVRAVISS